MPGEGEGAGIRRSNDLLAPAYSHSMVEGGLELMS